ncbi:transcriptional regulator [Klebsiella pneumoniae]|uniref:winged helix-turn-helix transcriptional regulator n=1 Tax=Klebsiella pneumoniae TaxID=573 RepID=UPI000E2B1D00|nr:helix-turn-helix domain-containing protein [Klebsiella pneumoniae]SYD58699.1 transcriptional regulator [Klebsiella pneumoniae]
MSKNKSLPYLDPALCGLAEGAKILGDRWVLLILREAFYGVTRFETLLSHTHITRQTLTTRLKTMTETGLLNKVPYREAGSRERYEYVLTDKSRSLALVLFALMEWGHQHDSASGEAVHPGFITASGTVASPAALQIVKADER